MNEPSNLPILGSLVIYLSVPPRAPEPYKVPCGPLKISTLLRSFNKKFAKTGKYDGVICLGAVIRGSTPHFDYVSSEVAKGIAKVGLDDETPVIFGVLTTDTIEQAIERAGTKSGNKGWDAALAAIEMVNLIKSID